MTTLALTLVLISAVFHATWNYLAKRMGGGGATFIWLFTLISAVVYAPLGIGVLLIQRPEFGTTQLIAVGISSCLHILYFVLLTRGYRTGDLSLVYPLARGTGPMLSTAGAILLMGERPLPIAVAGAVLIGIGIMILTGDPRKFRSTGSRKAITYALLTGLVIATYTLWDKNSVSVIMIPPLLYDWVSSILRTIILTPHALQHRQQALDAWQKHRLEALGIGILSPLSYILVLTALTFSPVSYIAPAREISILLGALLGSRLLDEGDSRRRVMAACAMMIGVAALALG